MPVGSFYSDEMKLMMDEAMEVVIENLPMSALILAEDSRTRSLGVNRETEGYECSSIESC